MVYRENMKDPIKTQMKYACQLLYEWKKFRPIIAGGALWAWAAGNPARDIDIFAKNCRKSRKKASEYIHDSTTHLKRKVIINGYFSCEEARPIVAKAYRSLLPDGTPIDIVLVPKSGENAIQFFDYKHCMVGFGADGANLYGVPFYIAGELVGNHKDPRPEKVIEAKIQKSLWGNDNAETAIVKIINKLNDIYHSG